MGNFPKILFQTCKSFWIEYKLHLIVFKWLLFPKRERGPRAKPSAAASAASSGMCLAHAVSSPTCCSWLTPRPQPSVRPGAPPLLSEKRGCFVLVGLLFLQGIVLSDLKTTLPHPSNLQPVPRKSTACVCHQGKGERGGKGTVQRTSEGRSPREPGPRGQDSEGPSPRFPLLG